jgi:ribose transport system substrate-binding protein
MRKLVAFAAVVAPLCWCGCSKPDAGPASPEQSKATSPGDSAGKAASAPAAGKKPDAVVGVSVLTTTNPFFVDLANAMREEGAKHNFEVLVTSGEQNVANQKNQVNEFIAKQVSAIVLCPCDSRAIGTSIAAANAAGIPVFTADIACLAKDAKVVTHVATDNLGGGRKAAEVMIEMLGGNGKVAILDYPEAESVIQRTTGFHEVIAKAKGIEVVGSWPGGGDRGKSFKAAQDILQAHSDLDAFFAINDPSGLGAAAALEAAGRADRVRIVSFDAQPIGRRGVKEGKIYATIVQYPEKIGQKTIDAVARYLAGEEVEREILIPCSVYGKADAEADPSLK